MYSISIFILHFTHMGVRTHPTHPPAYGPGARGNVASLTGDAENARHEIAGHENAAPECKGGKCET